jgi:eukaryotic-like serine/threonine-protein kinase
MPKVLGRYHIISELGRGGMGVVYKAVDPKLERFIAIKCLSDELSNDELTVTRFLREARNVAALNHPHIAQIFLADEDEGKPYFVMEYVDGESLAERLARDGRLLPEQARRIVTESAEALKAAHEENIVHRDVKPGNIMIDRRGRSVLTDFGIASIVHPDNQPTASKYIMGTPGYLPPEVMTGRPADHRGDIFALGAVYYEMLAGKRLVPGQGIEDTARTLLAADFPELGDLDEQLDRSTFGVLGRMLAPDPDKRYQDYDQLLADLSTGPVETAAPARSAQAVSDESEPATRLANQPVASVHSESELAATQSVDPAEAGPPSTRTSPPPAGRSRVRRAGLLGVLVLSVVMVGLGVARLAPERWDQVTGLFGADQQAPLTETTSGDDGRGDALQDEEREPVVADVGIELAMIDDHSRASERQDLSDDASPPHQAPEGIDEPAAEVMTGESGLLAGSARLVDDSEPRDEQPAVLPASQQPDSAPERATDRDGLVLAQSPADAEPAGEADDGGYVVAEPAPARRVPAPQHDPQPTPTLASNGVVVIGVGDAVIVDPMVREIELALRADGYEVLERGFVSGLAGVTGGSEVDLAGLSRVATAAGARYAVIARAMPAGQRELNYYGRTDTAYIVQIETVTYDLAERRRLGASDLEQIEYTALSATRLARDSIAPQLARISQQLAQ